MLVKKILFFPLILVGSKRIVNKITKLAKSYAYEDCEIVGSAAGRYGVKECIPKAVFEPRMFMSFEQQQFQVSTGYDTYLTNLYGNYMEIPKKKKTHLR